MGLQLIFVVETKKSCKSDYILRKLLIGSMNMKIQKLNLPLYIWMVKENIKIKSAK